jgi:hypothetical protein
MPSASSGPWVKERAMAQFNLTIGLPVISTSAAYNCSMASQSVSANVGARACRAAISACRR